MSGTRRVDIAPEMIARARELDPGGDYRLIAAGDFSQFELMLLTRP